MNRKSRTRLLVSTIVIVVVVIIGVVVLVERQGSYYRQVSDLTSQFVGKNVQVGGKVLNGSIARNDSGVHFLMQDLTGKATTVKVTYDGQMPSTFAPGVDVVVTGKYASDGVISADQLETKCPSKYKAQATTPPQTSAQ